MVRKCLGFLSLSPVVANVPSRYISNSSHSCLVNCSDSYVMLLRGILADPFMQVSDFLTMEHKELLTHTDSLPKNCNWILGSTNFKKLQDTASSPSSSTTTTILTSATQTVITTITSQAYFLHPPCLSMISYPHHHEFLQLLSATPIRTFWTTLAGTGTAAAWLKQCRSQISRH